ncbi:unnamed protein product [Kluyveromyces dobzhanskii CBS 2104]|uniref:WGS project CCBQ000000000 data, contig 00015 n=1 Tax=Kluyveromyces dobzhanskii CBS 2104 TaxID=1427455 RepID=A0A0A8L9U6_9SACH|nr:unnamed protein product [Kluyveromyces dobzhanskii CBS 2104]
MDKNERLQLMRQKIEALQQQRKKIDSKHEEISESTLPFISHITNTLFNEEATEKKKVETAEISVQTDLPDATEPVIKRTPVLTYDIGIQTDEYLIKDECIEESRLHSSKVESEEQALTNDSKSAEAEKALDVNEFEFGNVGSFDDYATLNKDTFSLQEALQATLKPATQNFGGGQNLNLYLKIAPKLAVDNDSDSRVISSDVIDDVLVTVTHIIAKYVKSSLVQISHIPSGEILDAVLFRGQNIVRSKFIHNPGSKITSTILSCYTGKIILYELRTIKVNESFRIERNMISVNYHNYPVFTFIFQSYDEHSMLAASTNGQLKSISTLDLSLKEDNDVKIVPIPRTDLSYSNEETQPGDKFYRHLLVISLYDELSILCMVLVPSDPSSLYVGCEDGYIYKVSQLPFKGDKKGQFKIAKDNNGFIPNSTSAVENGSLFHEGPVTGLELCAGIDGVFFSFSIDGDLIFWDAMNHSKLGTVEYEDAILSAKWIAKNGKYYVAILSSFSFQIRPISFAKDPEDKWQWADTLISETLTLVPSDTPLTEFSSFEFISTEETGSIVLCGTDSTIFCYAIKSL